MASLLDQHGRTDSASNPEPPPWAREVANSIATRPSRASSLISTRTRFSTTTFQEDAKSIDLSISGHHFRISRDGSKVTTVNPGESLPAYPFSPANESSQHDRPAHRYVAFNLDSDTNLANEPTEESVDSRGALSAQSILASRVNGGTSSSTGSNGSVFEMPPEVSNASDRQSVVGVALDNAKALDRQTKALERKAKALDSKAKSFDSKAKAVDSEAKALDKANTLNSMAVRIQRAWRNYVQYRGPSSAPALTTRQQASTNPQVRRRAAPIPIPVPKKSNAILDKELPDPGKRRTARGNTPILGKPTTVPIGDSGLSLFTIDIDRGSHGSHESLLPVAGGPATTEQLSLGKWFTGEGTKRFRDTDDPASTPMIHPTETIDSENDVSNHYTRMIRFIDRDYRKALHARDKEMAELRERLNEKDVVYRQELRARDFLIEDLKKRLDHSEEQMEAEIEKARNAVEDLWESRWKDRDFHLRERMQRMESDMQKTMETGIAEREAAWSAKFEKLRRTLETSPSGMDE